MKILECRAYRGPNAWSRGPVISIKLDLQQLEHRPTNTIEGFVEGVLAVLPSLASHKCSEGHAGGFVSRMREGTWLGHVLEHLAIELQNRVGSEVAYGKTFTTKQHGIYNIIYSYVQEEVGINAGQMAFRLIQHLVHGTEFNFAAELENLASLADELVFGPSTQALVDEASKRNIPFIRLNEGNLVQLGYGKYQKRIQATITSSTSWIAVDIASDKELTKRILADIGIPVPRGSVVSDWDEAQEAIAQIGFPVVIKPADASQGRGCAINICNMKSAQSAVEEAIQHSSRVIIEQSVCGEDYRLLVVNGQFVAAAQRTPAQVIGDGRRTIAQLIDDANSDPRRGRHHEKPLSLIQVDAELLRRLSEQGFDLSRIPALGTVVWLKHTANLSTGATAADCTDKVHPAIREMAVRASKAIGLDIAGIDLITTDVSQPLQTTKGAVCEVNAAPSLRMHLHPSSGIPRNVADPVIRMLFPEGTPARIPVIAVTGTNGKTTTVRMIAHLLKMAGNTVGFTTTDGVYINGHRILKGDMSGPWSAQVVLKDPTVDFAVLETARGGILRSGLGFDLCDVGVITNIEEDHLGAGEVETLEDLAHLKSLVLEVVKNDGYALINAEDRYVLALREHFGGHPFYFAFDGNNDEIQNQLRAGGDCIFNENGVITIFHGRQELPVVDVRSIPATYDGSAKFNIRNAIVAIAAAYCVGVPLRDIRAGIQTFHTAYQQSPGRMNLQRMGDFSVLIDYAHNAAAVAAVGEFIKELRPHRTTGIIGMPGDRRDRDVLKLGEVAAAIFDRIIIKEDHDTRGRFRGEIAAMLQQGVNRGAPAKNCHVILDEVEAFLFALERAERNELIVIFCEDPSAIWEQLSNVRNPQPEPI